MSQWQKDKRWADNYMTEVKRALGEHLIGDAPMEEDRDRNTDLIVLGMAAVRIGVRIRKPEYYRRYHDEFTIRLSRPISGNKTEFQKIREGWGDYFFYGFAGQNGRLLHYTIANLHYFRLRLAVADIFGEQVGTTRENRDGSSDFMAYKWADFDPRMIVAQRSYHPIAA